jgi:hypothetical protein
VVEQVGCVLSDEALSPFLKPEYPAVMAGGVDPYGMGALEAVTVSGAGVTLTEPAT